jgi:hypothetical protein
LRAGEKRDGVAKESDQRKGADATEGVSALRGFVFFAFQSNQKREEEDEGDLDGVGWQKTIEFHCRPGSFERESIDRSERPRDRRRDATTFSAMKKPLACARGFLLGRDLRRGAIGP